MIFKAMHKYFSIVSILIAQIIIILKIDIDFSSYYTIKDAMAQTQDLQPTFFSNQNIIITFLMLLVISLIFSVIGFKKQNKYRKSGLLLNILAIIYTIIPVGVMLSLYKF